MPPIALVKADCAIITHAAPGLGYDGLQWRPSVALRLSARNRRPDDALPRLLTLVNVETIQNALRDRAAVGAASTRYVYLRDRPGIFDACRPNLDLRHRDSVASRRAAGQHLLT